MSPIVGSKGSLVHGGSVLVSLWRSPGTDRRIGENRNRGVYAQQPMSKSEIQDSTASVEKVKTYACQLAKELSRA